MSWEFRIQSTFNHEDESYNLWCHVIQDDFIGERRASTDEPFSFLQVQMNHFLFMVLFSSTDAPFSFQGILKGYLKSDVLPYI